MASGHVSRAKRPIYVVKKALANSEPSTHGTTRTFRNVRYSVDVGCKADIEQAASKMLDF